MMFVKDYKTVDVLLFFITMDINIYYSLIFWIFWPNLDKINGITNNDV